MSNLKTAMGKVHKGYMSLFGWTAHCNDNICELSYFSSAVLTEEPVTCKICLRMMAKEERT